MLHTSYGVQNTLPQSLPHRTQTRTTHTHHAPRTRTDAPRTHTPCTHHAHAHTLAMRKCKNHHLISGKGESTIPFLPMPSSLGAQSMQSSHPRSPLYYRHRLNTFGGIQSSFSFSPTPLQPLRLLSVTQCMGLATYILQKGYVKLHVTSLPEYFNRLPTDTVANPVVCVCLH